MTPTPGTPLTPEEEAQLRRDMNLDSPWAQPVADSWSWWLARTLATLDHEREAAASREALREVGDGYEVLTWVKHEPSGVVVLPGHPQLGGRYCKTDGADWPCSAVRAATAFRATPRSR